MGELSTALKALEQQQIDSVHVGIFDLDGGFRERRLKRADIAGFAAAATFVNVLPQWDLADRVFGAGPFVGEPIALDPASARRYPFEPNSALLVADFAGPSAELSPRKLLQRLIERAQSVGLVPKAAFEFEFIVLDETAESLRDKGFANLQAVAPDNRCWGSLTAGGQADFVAALEAALVEGDVPLFALGVELGPGCFEATLVAGDALRAADDAVFFRLFTKAFCRRQGRTASFMAQLGAEFPGLSGHIHLSLADGATGRNAFRDAHGADGLSALCRSFIAGVVELAPEAFALCANTVNAYRRITPGNWAPKTASWAVQNYAAAIRAVPEPDSHCRLEFRLPAADCNPFLALAFLLGAGLYGIEQGLEAPPPITGGGPDEIPEGAKLLPHDLVEATARLEACAPARAIFGDRFIDHYVASRRAEELALRREVSAAERARYLEAT